MRRIVAVAFVALGLSAGAGCTRPSSHTLPKGTPVVLISIDTLRSDRLPSYGYDRVKTPALSALRDEAVLFESAWAHAPLTLPSHATLFTGLPPAGNGLRDNLGYALKPSVPTLAELLKREGYVSGGAVTSVVLAGSTGVARGFDFWDDDVAPTMPFQAIARVQRGGGEAEASIAKWIEAQSGPFLAFLHLYEPHAPYEPPEPFRSEYRDAYDGEIAAADAVVGRFAAFLKSKGIWDRALVVLFSDHGEALGEHGESEHGVFLYREVLQVPLLVKLPKGSPALPKSVAAPVALSDVFTTVASAAGVKDFAPPAGTRSLLEVASAPGEARRLYAESFFPRTHFGWSELRSLLDGRWHYIDAPRPELYDLENDRTEKANLADGKPDAFRKLRVEMEARRSAFEAPAPADEETRKKLASLGYLSSGANAPSGPLPDPKDHVATVGLMKDALRDFVEGRPEGTVAITRRLLAENPRMLDVWELEAQALARMGRADEALAALRKTVELAPPGSTQYLLSFANHALRIGKNEEARKHAEVAKSLGAAGADEVLARACLASNDLACATSAANACVASPKDRDKGLLVLGQVATRRGDFAGALEAVSRIEAAGPKTRPLPGLHLLKGDVFARTGRNPEAEAEFREEIRAYPETLAPWTSLALLQAASGRAPEARKTLSDMVAAAPNVDAYLAAFRTLSILGDRAEAERWKSEGLRRWPRDERFRRAPKAV